MDSLALPLSSYKDILECISAIQHKQVSIEMLLTNRMQSTTTFMCGWWSLYYLISSKSTNSILLYLHTINNPPVKYFLYNYFKSLFEEKWHNIYTKTIIITERPFTNNVVNVQETA